MALQIGKILSDYVFFFRQDHVVHVVILTPKFGCLTFGIVGIVPLMDVLLVGRCNRL